MPVWLSPPLIIKLNIKMSRISELLQQPGTVVVDVRTPGEYIGGHCTNSINIPLNELTNRLDDFKQMPGIIVCCASGVRSQKASLILKQNSIECTDGGSWLDINKHLNN